MIRYCITAIQFVDAIFIEKKMAEAHEVHVGKHDYLFLLQGRNNVSSQYARSLEALFFLTYWQNVVDVRERRLLEIGIPYKHVLIPEKITVYDSILDGMDINWRLSPGYRLYHEDQYYVRFPLRRLRLDRFVQRRRRRQRTLIDLIEPMRHQRDQQNLFYRTDSHLSFSGRLLAYREICRAIGATPIHDFWERPTTYHPSWAGDLGLAFTPHRHEGTTLHHVQRDSVRVYASPIVAHRENLGQAGTLHTGAHVVYQNKDANDTRRVILFGDSYASFMPNGLTIMFAETFRELHFVWSTQLDYGYIERVKPDFVLAEMSERFIFRLCDDDWNMENYSRQRYSDELDAASD